MFSNCRFLGFQDTLYPHGEQSRQYYKNCYIEGTTDFIFGWSTAVFEDCEIFGKKGGHYITAASTLDENPYGFVFLNCRITGNAPENAYYLGRPWRPYAKTVFINCYMDTLIKPGGWHNWDKPGLARPDTEKTTVYAEYGSTGPGADPSSRVGWSHQLTKEEAEAYSLDQIFRDWQPEEKEYATNAQDSPDENVDVWSSVDGCDGILMY